ncbi:hypothetical protein P4T79_01415 [Bacillus mojavensis]|nr:hypothetical protein [Bacillus mojavensis]MEC1734343.1 hypothetical protein [Bacillus mojavensis]MED1005331.1 hypothetical protein [Bacillus mojavensis]
MKSKDIWRKKGIIVGIVTRAEAVHSIMDQKLFAAAGPLHF